MLRQATPGDCAAMHRVRMAVRENRLTSTVLAEDDYAAAISMPGRGWVIEKDGVIVGFAAGNSQTGNIWALFVDPAHEGHGYGRRLHDALVAWLFEQGLNRLWLTTEEGTRAERFYERAGWVRTGPPIGSEVRFELARGSY